MDEIIVRGECVGSMPVGVHDVTSEEDVFIRARMESRAGQKQ